MLPLTQYDELNKVVQDLRKEGWLVKLKSGANFYSLKRKWDVVVDLQSPQGEKIQHRGSINYVIDSLTKILKP